MSAKIIAISSILLLMVLIIVPYYTWASTDCTPVTITNQSFEGTATAAYVATSGQTVTGTIDALGCEIGVFVPATASGVTITATIHDASEFGVFVDGDSGITGAPNASGITVTESTIYNIGNHNAQGAFSPNGVQTGFGIFFSNGATGSITNNLIYNYQKAGIVVFDFTSEVSGNTVTGLGPVNFIAQNGIQLGYPKEGYFFPASNIGGVTENVVSQNIYTQGSTSGGNPFVATGVLGYFQLGNKGELTSALVSNNNVFNNQADVVVSVS
jgi:hypothetical protein